MSFNFFSNTLLLLSIVFSCYGFPGPVAQTNGKIWALLVAGSDGFMNYRHQADICHAYHILHSNGIPDENIIVMMVDDIAYSQDNPTPGIIINHPGGKDVYQGVPKDYTGKDVNAKNFLAVLTGDKEGVKGNGTGRVIESGPNDHVFVNFVDHGGPGILCFPDDVLSADDLIKTLKRMADKSQFAKLIMYIEACYSGSMFDNLLDDDLNIFVTTAADPHESSYACYFDDKRGTYLGDVFSVVWMEDIKHESLPSNDLHHQYERVRTLTNTSHVEEYGDLDIGNTKLIDVLGMKMKGERNLRLNKQGRRRFTIKDAHDNLHVPVQVLKNQLLKYKSPSKRRDLKMQLRALQKKRDRVDDVFDSIMDSVTDLTEQKDEISKAKYSLDKQNFPCYKALITSFSEKCFNIAQNPYVRAHLQKFVNICAISSITTDKVLNAIDENCDETEFVNFFAQ